MYILSLPRWWVLYGVINENICKGNDRVNDDDDDDDDMQMRMEPGRGTET